MNSLVSFFGGKVYKRSNQGIVKFVVTKHSDITKKVIPFFVRTERAIREVRTARKIQN
jgi:hypothetical protein